MEVWVVWDKHLDRPYFDRLYWLSEAGAKENARYLSATHLAKTGARERFMAKRVLREDLVKTSG